MEDARIVELFLQRNESAIQRTAEQYGTRLREISYHITADRMTAEECENDTYLEAWRLIPPNEPRNYLYAFLVRIIRHLSIDRCRAQKSLKRDALLVELSEELELCLPASENVEAVLDEKILGETISRFLLTQKQEKRIIFMRRYFYLDSIIEIAERLGIKESKVKTTLFRTRNDLKDFLMKEGYTL